jgi:hypothetical protein
MNDKFVTLLMEEGFTPKVGDWIVYDSSFSGEKKPTMGYVASVHKEGLGYSLYKRVVNLGKNAPDKGAGWIGAKALAQLNPRLATAEEIKYFKSNKKMPEGD